jgi:hypothetical protein
MNSSMYYPIGNGPLFRVAPASEGNVWPEPVMGIGAYYVGLGASRYSRTQQPTVYCAEDPIVAITEAAFYQALQWQIAVASYKMKTLLYPLRSEHLLWAFLINPIPPVIDMESVLAGNRFGYPPHLLLNPSRDYNGTQDVADSVRTHTPPAGSGEPRPEGMKIPSVRTPWVGGFQPHHLSLFVMNTVVAVPFSQRSTLVAKMKIGFEFQTHSPARSVTYQSPRINWSAPRFKVTAIQGEPSLSLIPAFAGRPKARAFSLSRWYRIGVVF